MPSFNKIHPKLTSPEQFSTSSIKSHNFELDDPWSVLRMGLRASFLPCTYFVLSTFWCILILQLVSQYRTLQFFFKPDCNWQLNTSFGQFEFCIEIIILGFFLHKRYTFWRLWKRLGKILSPKVNVIHRKLHWKVID